jgi:hypothetical protein
MDARMLDGVLEVIGPDDFFRDRHQIIFRVIRDLHESGKPVDLITVLDELGNRDQLDESQALEILPQMIAGVPHPENAEYYARIVRQKSLGRGLIVASEETRAGAYDQSETVEELISRASDRLASLGASEDEPDFVPLRPSPEPPGAAVYQGLAGDIVGMIAPHTEADPMAILAQLLVCFGSVIGRRAHWRVEGTKHYTNLFACIVGNSSKARKGTSWDHVYNMMASCDEEWAKKRILTGMSSGEGLIWSVRDPVDRIEKSGGEYKMVRVDEGEEDKRALFVETEFGSTLSILNRDGNSLCGIIRQAWDHGRLAAATKHNPARATDAHISIVGHVTCEELHRRLTATDAANGFANRFVWVYSSRSKYLPDGGRITEVNFTDAVNRMREAIEFGRDEFRGDVAPMVRDHHAKLLWHEVYPRLSEPKPGLLGAVTSRAEAQVMRIACLYALLDRTKYILKQHLEAGLAFWRYSEQSAAYIFGDALGDPNAEKLLKALVASGEAGLSMTEIRRKVFMGHRTLVQLNSTLGILARGGMVAMETDTSTRKPTTRWKAVQGPKGNGNV